ncbi:uncharacterized protein LOC103580490 isoform X2 [Microplitis demolitor]|uniref:uncharacterized protein LOC103580490 isoform X2 n=1 Tax=Microplitis demolitor TaxID=69319 RepID=UPI00235B6CC7|nr:uncharacterized protein LOC103580490 isoform X2 [Microplitis demolitor]
MVKCCTVLNCLSGKKKERKKNNDSNPRQTSLFKIPQDVDKLRKWSLALCQNLTSDKFVCELHFSDDDIIKIDMLPIFNQDTYISNRKKYTLKPNAISRVDRIPNVVEAANLQIDSDNVLPAARTPEVETSSSTPDLNEQSENTQHENLSLRETNFNSDRLLETLKTNMLPEKWSWASDATDNQKIFLFYADPKSLSLKFHVKIDEALNIMVTNLKTNKSTAITFTLLNKEDFWDLLKELETINFCDGTGFDSNRCSVSCENLLTNENQRYYHGITRCQPCRTLRRQLQNRDNKSTQN